MTGTNTDINTYINTEIETCKALLAVSFGTTHEETRRATIDAIETDLAAAFPERKLYRGWTSGMILRILKKRTGRSFDTVEEALDRMASDGIKDVLVQPTHIISGEENERMMNALRERRDRFERIAAGRPLLAGPADLEELARILAAELLDEEGSAGSAPDRILLLMGHGSADKPEANRVYHELQEVFRRLGHDDVFVATVEGSPSFEDALAKMSGLPDRTVVLAPLMIVAGDHAKNDMAGEGGDSWKNRLCKAGFEVIPVLRGLGEYPAVRKMFVRHAEQGLSYDKELFGPKTE